MAEATSGTEKEHSVSLKQSGEAQPGDSRVDVAEAQSGDKSGDSRVDVAEAQFGDSRADVAEAQSGDSRVDVTTVNGTNHSDESDLDVTDGFISQYFMSPQGTYSPRKLEKEWGTDVDQGIEQEDRHDTVYHLLKNTIPEVRWRQGIFYMLKENKSETSTRKCLAFLHSNAVSGIKAVESGEGATVYIDDNPVPKHLTCPDWMMVMEGLNFDLTSPGAVRNIEHVNVAVGKKTDKHALEGFCNLMKAMLEMTWTNLQAIPRIEKEEGQILNDILATLCSGSGIDESDRSKIDEIESKYPFLMKTLGFRRREKQARLQWQKPDPDIEFQRLCLTFHGLFSSADKMLSVL